MFGICLRTELKQTISGAMSKQLEACEICCYRRMLKILYIEHKTNEEVLAIIKIERSLIVSIKKRKAKYFSI